jgi:hypothetical protein
MKLRGEISSTEIGRGLEQTEERNGFNGQAEDHKKIRR